MRDQILASGTAQLLAGKALDLDAFIPQPNLPPTMADHALKTPFEHEPSLPRHRALQR